MKAKSGETAAGKTFSHVVENHAKWYDLPRDVLCEHIFSCLAPRDRFRCMHTSKSWRAAILNLPSWPAEAAALQMPPTWGLHRIVFAMARHDQTEANLRALSEAALHKAPPSRRRQKKAPRWQSFNFGGDASFRDGLHFSVDARAILTPSKCVDFGTGTCRDRDAQSAAPRWAEERLVAGSFAAGSPGEQRTRRFSAAHLPDGLSLDVTLGDIGDMERTWSPRGQHVATWSRHMVRRLALRIYRHDGKELACAVEPARYAGRVHQRLWSPNEETLVSTYDWGIVSILSVKTGNMSYLNTGGVHLSHENLIFNHSGTKALFWSNFPQLDSSPEQKTVAMLDLQTNALLFYIHVPMAVGMAAWSDDDSRLVLACRSPDERFALFLTPYSDTTLHIVDFCDDGRAGNMPCVLHKNLRPLDIMRRLPAALMRRFSRRVNAYEGACAFACEPL